MQDGPIPVGLTFDDVLLVPQKSDVLPAEVKTTTRLTRHCTINIPIVSASMDTVTESRLAIAIARRILHRELTLDPDSIHGLVKAAFQKLQTREIHRVRLHRDQEAFVRESLSKLMPSGSIEIIVDPTLQPGDVIFEGAQGDLDASIDTQLREIERGFADRLEI